MNVGLVCPPPGAAIQGWLELRRAQAEALAGLGCTVHLIGRNLPERIAPDGAVYLHRLSEVKPDCAYSEQFPALDEALAYSQQLFERLAALDATAPLSIVDMPLPYAAGLVTVTYLAAPVVLTALDAAAVDSALLALEQQCLERAAGLVIAADSDAVDWLAWESAPDLSLSINPNGAGPFEAAALAAFYQQVGQAYAIRLKQARRVYQVADALDYGDAVGNIMRRNAQMLPQVGGESLIMAKYAHPQVEAEVTKFHPVRIRPDDGIIFHYWGYSELADVVVKHPGPKALYYHNITPPEFFPPGSHNFEMCRRGYRQIAEVIDSFDLLIGVSNYDIVELRPYLAHSTPALVVPPVIEMAAERAGAFDETVYRQLKAAAPVNFLFVGRVARNKRQDLLMQMFDYYYRYINRHSRLYLVGNQDHSSDYFQELETLRRSLAAREQIIFAGKVPEAALQAYYRAADVFVSASEHEGFGVPLLEAMAHDLPVVAQAGSAVPETMGRAGVLIHRWDIPRVAELINLLFKDQTWRAQLMAGQRENLNRFTETVVREQLAAVVTMLQTGAQPAAQPRLFV